jgi:hypothetical protein
MCRKTTSKPGLPARLADRYPKSCFHCLFICIIACGIGALALIQAEVPAVRPFFFLLKVPWKLMVATYDEIRVLQQTDDLDSERRQILHKSKPTKTDMLFLHEYPPRLQQIQQQDN